MIENSTSLCDTMDIPIGISCQHALCQPDTLNNICQVGELVYHYNYQMMPRAMYTN